GFIVMGNEGKGISDDIRQLTDYKLTIPSFAQNTFSTESLNVGVATGIILSEFKRR
ncbi:MAG: RNA methyltransferase, partial [Odoribacter sp.]|nr:RNA methyltransferase [Odoribacter sp.]